LAARSARLAGKWELRDLASIIAATFHRYLQHPVKTDPGCHAKIAAVEALTALDLPDADVLLKGIRHVQLEPSFGLPIDTAELLRAACAFGLYHMGHPDLLCEMVTLLMDSKPGARRAAVRVLADLGQETSEMLLRLKVLQGDSEPEIIGDCLSGLLSIAPLRSLGFAEQCLGSEDPRLIEEAALAIGNSRFKGAFGILSGCRERNVLPEIKRMLLLPIALTRCDEAFALLLKVLQEEHRENAIAAIEALSVYATNPDSRERIREAAYGREDRLIREACEKRIIQGLR